MVIGHLEYSVGINKKAMRELQKSLKQPFANLPKTTPLKKVETDAVKATKAAKALADQATLLRRKWRGKFIDTEQFLNDLKRIRAQAVGTFDTVVAKYGETSKAAMNLSLAIDRSSTYAEQAQGKVTRLGLAHQANIAIMAAVNDRLFMMSPALAIMSGGFTAGATSVRAFITAMAPLLLIGAAVFGTIAAINRGLRESIEIEKEQANVRKTTELTADSIERLTNSFRRLSTELPMSTVELLEVAAVAGQLGIKGVENIDEFSRTIAKLSLATDVVGDEGATQLARFLQATGVATRDFGREAAKTGDVLNALENTTAATAAEILKTTEYSGQLATRFRLTRPELLGIGAAIRSVGQSAEASGTALSKTFSDIESAALSGGYRLERMAELAGVTAEAFRELALENPAEAFRLLVNGMGEAAENGESLTKILGDLGMVEERQVRVVSSLAGGREKLNEALATANDETETLNSLNREAAIQSETTAAKLTRLWNGFNNLLGLLGNALKPAFDGIVDVLLEIVTGINSTLSPTEDFGDATLDAAGKVTVLSAAIGDLFSTGADLNSWLENATDAAENFGTSIGETLGTAQFGRRFMDDLAWSWNDFLKRMGWWQSDAPFASVTTWDDPETPFGPQPRPEGGGSSAASEQIDNFLTLAKLRQQLNSLEEAALQMQLEGNEEALAGNRAEREALEAQIEKWELLLGLRKKSSEQNSDMTVAKVMKQYADSIEAATGEFELFNDETAFAQAQLSAAETALKGLLDPNTIGDGTAQIAELADIITTLRQDTAKQGVFDTLAEAGSRAVRESLAAGDTLESKAKSVETRIGLMQGAITDLFMLGFNEADAEVQYLRVRMRELVGELSRYDAALARRLASRERQIREQTEMDDGQTPEAVMSWEDIRAQLKANRERDQRLADDRRKAQNEVRADILNFKAEVESIGAEVATAVREGDLDNLEALEEQVVDLLDAAGERPDGAPLMGFLVALRQEIERLAREGRMEEVAAITRSHFGEIAESVVRVTTELNNVRSSFKALSGSRDLAGLEALEQTIVDLLDANGEDPRYAPLVTLLFNVRKEMEAIEEATERAAERQKRFANAQALRSGVDPEGFLQTLTLVARSEGAIDSYSDALDKLAAAGIEVDDAFRRFLQGYFADSYEMMLEGVEAARELREEMAQLAELRFGGEQGILFTLQAVQRSEGAFTSVADAVRKFGNLKIPLTPELLAAIERMFEAAEHFGDDPGNDILADLGFEPSRFDELRDRIRAAFNDSTEATKAFRDQLLRIVDTLETLDKIATYTDFAANIVDSLANLDPSSGNSLIETASEMAAEAASTFIPVVGEQIAGIIRTIGSVVSTVLGDMSNGMKEVEAFIEDTAKSGILGEDIVRGLTVTKQVSRGGILGFFGFTKTAIDEEITNLQLSIAEGLAGGIAGAIAQGIRDGAAGSEDAYLALGENLKMAVLNALIDAFVQGAVIQGVLGPFIKTFTDLLVDENGNITEQSVDAAFQYADQNFQRVFDQALAITDRFVTMVDGSNLAPTPSDSDGGSRTTGVTIPTAPTPIMAAPSWARQLENAGMLIDRAAVRFDSAVDRLLRGGGQSARQLRNTG